VLGKQRANNNDNNNNNNPIYKAEVPKALASEALAARQSWVPYRRSTS